MKILSFILLIVGAILGIFYNVFSLYSLYKFIATSNHEFLMGVASPLIISTPSWFFASIGAYMVRNKLNVALNNMIYILFLASTLSLVYFFIFG